MAATHQADAGQRAALQPSKLLDVVIGWTVEHDVALLRLVDEKASVRGACAAAAAALGVPAGLLHGRWAKLLLAAPSGGGRDGPPRPWTKPEMVVLTHAMLCVRARKSLAAPSCIGDGAKPRVGSSRFYQAMALFLHGRTASAIRQIINSKLCPVDGDAATPPPSDAQVTQAWEQLLAAWAELPVTQLRGAEAQQHAARLLREATARQQQEAAPADARAASCAASPAASSHQTAEAPAAAAAAAASLDVLQQQLDATTMHISALRAALAANETAHAGSCHGSHHHLPALLAQSSGHLIPQAAGAAAAAAAAAGQLLPAGVDMGSSRSDPLPTLEQPWVPPAAAPQLLLPAGAAAGAGAPFRTTSTSAGAAPRDPSFSMWTQQQQQHQQQQQQHYAGCPDPVMQRHQASLQAAAGSMQGAHAPAAESAAVLADLQQSMQAAQEMALEVEELYSAAAGAGRQQWAPVAATPEHQQEQRLLLLRAEVEAIKQQQAQLLASMQQEVLQLQLQQACASFEQFNNAHSGSGAHLAALTRGHTS